MDSTSDTGQDGGGAPVQRKAPLLSRAVDFVSRAGASTATTVGIAGVSCVAGAVIFLGFRRGFKRVIERSDVQPTKPNMHQGLAIIMGGFLTSTALLGGATYAVASRFDSMEDFDRTMRSKLSNLPYVKEMVERTSGCISPVVDDSKGWLAEGVQGAMAKVGLSKLGSSVPAVEEEGQQREEPLEEGGAP